MSAEQPPAASWGADTDGRLNQSSEHLTEHAMLSTDASGNTVLVGGDGNYLAYAGKVKKSALMTRSMGGKFIAANALTDYTTSIGMVLAAHYDQVRLIIPNMHTSAIDNVKACVAPTNTIHGATQLSGGSAANSHITPSGGVGTWVDVTFSGSATVSLPLSDGVTPTYTASDWMDVRSIDRIDGGPGSVVLVRIEQPAAGGKVTQMFGSTFDKWGNTADVGDRIYRASRQTVLGVTTKAACTSYGWEDIHHAVIVQYMSRVSGMTITCFGDSISEGTGIDPANYSWAHLSAVAVSSSTCPVECANFGWGSADPDDFYAQASLIVPLVKPSIAFWAAFTPNLTLNAAGINTMRKYTATFKRFLSDYNTVPVMWTGLPSTYGLAQGKDWSAGADALRVAYNAEILASGEVTCDFASVMTGGFNATNTAQYDMLSGSTTDGLHPNSVGASIMTTKAVQTLNYLGINS